MLIRSMLKILLIRNLKRVRDNRTVYNNCDSIYINKEKKKGITAQITNHMNSKTSIENH